MKTIELKTTSISLRDDGIMHIHIKAGAQMELADAIQVVEAMGQLDNGEKHPALVDCDEFASVDKETRILSANEEANIFSSANALAYHSLAHKLLANFYVNYNKPEVPTRIFSDNEATIKWLKTFKD